ncbi:MAG: hypothetical protein K0U93_25395 [Gammaproteobacteria bacterium]|nr:hypothetical protein [Gammaproteobacteria bacterium]
MEASDHPVFAEDADYDEVQEAILAYQIGDGLPVVPPTQQRMAQMLEGISNPTESFGPVPPLFGDLTPEAVAYQCVLAGCRREELPVVFSAIEACLEPSFNLLGILTTTGTVSVAVAIHGPLAQNLEVSGTTNCLGPGVRANACIGRAVSMVLRNVGGARAGVGDMATMGQPGKYTFCFAEDKDEIVPSLHRRRGFVANSSAVTVLGVSGTLEVLPSGDGDCPEAIFTPVAEAMRTAYRISGAARKDAPGEQALLLPPELARFVCARGWDVSRIQAYLFEHLSWTDQGEVRHAARAAEDIHIIVTGGPGVKMTYAPLWGGGTTLVTRPIHQFS